VQRLHVAASDSSASRGAANVLLDQAAFGLLERRAMTRAKSSGLRPVIVAWDHRVPRSPSARRWRTQYHGATLTDLLPPAWRHPGYHRDLATT